LLLLRAYELDRFNAAWGDAAADRKHALLWYATCGSIVVAVGVGIVMALVSRIALYSVVIGTCVILVLGVIAHYGPHPIQMASFIPLFPGYLAAVLAFGVHDDSVASGIWFVTTNALIYSIVVYAILRCRKAARVR
jgi:uncharacterized protein (DUF2062 family)